jgi:hypothetical protein
VKSGNSVVEGLGFPEEAGRGILGPESDELVRESSGT